MVGDHFGIAESNPGNMTALAAVLPYRMRMRGGIETLWIGHLRQPPTTLHCHYWKYISSSVACSTYAFRATASIMSPSLVALITAGSAGLGAATARVFASAGMRVIINYSSNISRADMLVQDLEKLSPLSTQQEEKCFTSIQADLTKRLDIIRLVSESIAKMGRLDVVFSNGGWTAMRDFNDLDDNVLEENWDKCWNMNVKSHLWLMHAARRWLDETEGVFITTASLAGVRPSGSSLVRKSLRLLAFRMSMDIHIMRYNKGGLIGSRHMQ